MNTCFRMCGVVAASLVSASAFATTLNGTLAGSSTWRIYGTTTDASYNWNAGWNVDPTTRIVTIRQTLKLVPVGTTTITGAEMTSWETSIEGAWNRPEYSLISLDTSNGQTTSWTMRYDITLATNPAAQNYTVNVNGTGTGTNAGTWYKSEVNDAAYRVAAHECGHYLANADEYFFAGAWIVNGAAYNANPFTTTSLMNNTQFTANPVGRTQPRHYGLWESALNDYNLAKGGVANKLIYAIPAPGGVSLLGLFVIAARRRR